MPDVIGGLRISRGVAYRALREQYGFSDYRARRVLEIANEFGRKAEPCPGGFVHVVYRGWSPDWPYVEQFNIFDHTGPARRGAAPARKDRVAPDQPIGYNHPRNPIRPTRGQNMARGRASTKAAEPDEVEDDEEDEGTPAAKDYAQYATKNLTPTMQDFAAWVIDNVFGGDEEAYSEADPDRLIALGPTLYHDFQRSDFNKEQKEARRQERSQASDDEEDEEEEQPKRSRGAVKAPATKTTATKAPAKAAAAKAPPAKGSAPARRGSARRAKTGAPY